METSSECCFGDFEAAYYQSALPEMKAIEQAVLGTDYGATSWMTRSQAENVLNALKLESGGRHLELGSGSGWPGLFFSQESGAETVLLDIPLVALQQAVARAEEDGLQHRIGSVQADATQIPFSAEKFDTISHSDVLCCLPDKQGMLSECRRVARNESRMVFSVILIAADLPDDVRERALVAGPPFVDCESDYESLLAGSGWELERCWDETGAYLDCLVTLHDEMTQRSEALIPDLGQEELDRQLEARQAQVACIREGALKRVFYSVRTIE